MGPMARYAAIDVGSNSVRMEAAELIPGSPVCIIASDREVTRLGESVFRDGRISPAAMEHTCRVLQRMAAALRTLDLEGVRAVATSSVRDARNQSEFLSRASEAAGVPVEVISGREEARLIHLGVNSRWPQPARPVLIVDIGGGSAEVVLGENGRMRDAVSKPLGAVRLRENFLSEDPPDPRRLLQMEEYIDDKLAGLPRRFGGSGWARLIATSATARAVACVTGGVSRANRDQADRIRVSAAQVRRLYQRLIPLDLAARRRIAGIGPRRAEIVVPGVAVLTRVLRVFGMPHLHYSTAGVRDGIVADLAARGVGRDRGRLTPEQRREVERVALHYGVSLRRVRRTAALALALFDQLHALHRLPAECAKLLEAGAYLHDVGHYISDASHHKHSYYLVANSDLSGFTAREREFVAQLCRYHRKSLPTAAHPGFGAMGEADARALLRLVPLLRIAVSLNQWQSGRVRALACEVAPGGVTIVLEADGEPAVELWGAERADQAFLQVFGTPVAVTRHRRSA